MTQNPLDPVNLLWAMSVPLLILLVSWFRRDPRQRWQDAVTVIGFSGFGAFAGLSMILMMDFIPSKDPLFLKADTVLGFDTVTFANAISSHRVAMVVLQVTYMALAPVFGIVWLLERNVLMRKALLIGGCLALISYAFFPAVGPGNFDWVRNVPHRGAPFNCMPSMHIGWPLLMAFNARSRSLRVWLWAYVGAALVSTLALREHYVVDLIAAFPFALGVQWISSRLSFVRGPLVLQFRNVNAPPPEAAALTVMLKD